MSDIASGTITPAGGSLLVVLYALRIDGIGTELGNDDEWGNYGNNVLTAVSDTFEGTSAWWAKGAVVGNAKPTSPVWSWMLAAAYAEVGPRPGSGQIRVHTVGASGHPVYAWMNVVEVQNWQSYTGLSPTTGRTSLVGGVQVDMRSGGGSTAPTGHLRAKGTGDTPGLQQGVEISLVMADIVDGLRTMTPARNWQMLQHDTPTEMEVETAYLWMAKTDPEETPEADWEALSMSAYSHTSVTLFVPGVEITPPTPLPFAEFLVEFQDETGAWIDITCDTRTADVDSGRSELLADFNAATLTLTVANFQGVYSPWPPDSVWAAAGRYRTDVPIRVNMVTNSVIGGVVTNTLHPLFTGTTDSINDSWPGPGIDAMVTITASDGFKKMTRVDSLALGKNPDGTDVTIGAGETTGQRILRWANRAMWTGPTAIDTGITRLLGTTMEGNALTEMQSAAFEEGLGVVYVRADGTLTFRQRDAALTDPRQTTAQATFSDRDDDPPGACYSDILPEADETQVYNFVQIGTKGAPAQTAMDPDSMAHFGPRTYPAKTDTDIEEWNDDLAVGILLVYTHADNEKRVSQIVVNPGFDQTLWDMACNLQLLDRVRVVRHFPGASGYVLDQGLAVQGIHHHIEGTGQRIPGIWSVTYDTVHALPMTDGAVFCKWDVGAWDSCSWGI